MVRPTVDTANLKHTCTNYPVSTINSLINVICCHLRCRAVFSLSFALSFSKFFSTNSHLTEIFFLRWSRTDELSASGGHFSWNVLFNLQWKSVDIEVWFSRFLQTGKNKAAGFGHPVFLLARSIQRFANISQLAKRWICSFLGRGAWSISNKYSSSFLLCRLGSGWVGKENW